MYNIIPRAEAIRHPAWVLAIKIIPLHREQKTEHKAHDQSIAAIGRVCLADE